MLLRWKRPENSIFWEPCLAISIPEIITLLIQVVANPSDGNEKESLLSGVHHRWFSQKNYSWLRANACNFIRCATSAPDGSSPRGYSWIFLFEYRLKVSSSAYRIFDLRRNILPCDRFSIGCAISAPDGSIPRGYNGVLAADHRLK
jgi:hypothetical protein